MIRSMLVATTLALLTSVSSARDFTDPTLTPEEQLKRAWWFARQMRPDDPLTPCCGSADAYYADKTRVVKDQVFAIITDSRPDLPLGRPNIPIGTEILVPPEKNKDTRGDPNLTGHTIIFVKWATEATYGIVTHSYWQVYCYIIDDDQ